LSDFLLNSRSGHCEFFATATVLLLRAAGVPARYAVGYSAGEFSKLENLIVVRGRHAHAWSLVYLNGNWHNFDTTPSSWQSIEAETVSRFTFILDFFSFLNHRFTKWRHGEWKKDIAKYSYWLLIPLAFIIIRRLYIKKRIKRVKIDLKQKDQTRPVFDSFSKFFLIEKRLNELGYERNRGETFPKWIKRIEYALPPSVSYNELYELVILHFRERFDVNKLSEMENEALNSGIARVISVITIPPP